MANERGYADNFTAWQDTLVKAMARAQDQCRRKNFYEQNKWDNQVRYAQNVQHQQVPDIGCLGCTRFFISGWNILDPRVNKCQVGVLGNAKLLKELTEESHRQKMNVRKEIEAMLNGSGGVLLFDIDRVYLFVEPRGEEITEREKVQIKGVI